MSKIGARIADRCAAPVLSLQLALVGACSSAEPTVLPADQSPAEADVGAPRRLAGGGTTRVVLLGTGTPNANPDRGGPALAVVVDGVAYLVDAGPGVVRNAARAAREHGIEALRAERLGHVFLTHLHSDHSTGLADLILGPWVLGRTDPLVLVGPSGTRDLAGHLRAAYRQDVEIRRDGLEPANATGYETEVRELSGDEMIAHEDQRIRVTAFRVPHGGWTNAYGYRFETADRTVVVSGDTGPAPELMIRMCDRCDLLIHEVYARAGWERREPEWQAYHAAFHTSGPELGRIAAAARPGRLILNHQLLWGATPEQLLAEVAGQWGGPISYGNDLDVY